jgi:hypothetical protein
MAIPSKDFWRFKSLTLLKYRRVLTTDYECKLKSFLLIIILNAWQLVLELNSEEYNLFFSSPYTLMGSLINFMHV